MFGTKRPIVTPEQEAAIEYCFRILLYAFGKDWLLDAPLVLPNGQFFPEKYEPTEEWGRQAFRRVCELMHLQPERATPEFMRDHRAELSDKGIHVVAAKGNAAGLYFGEQFETGRGPATVGISISLLKQPERMTAVMAHEIAHVLILGYGIIPPDFEYMEPLTDIMTVFSGFGIFSANAAFAHETGNWGWQVWRTGYLSEREFAYALALFAWLKGETKPVWTRELRKNVRVFTETTLAIFRATNKPQTILSAKCDPSAS